MTFCAQLPRSGEVRRVRSCILLTQVAQKRMISGMRLQFLTYRISLPYSILPLPFPASREAYRVQSYIIISGSLHHISWTPPSYSTTLSYTSHPTHPTRPPMTSSSQGLPRLRRSPPAPTRNQPRTQSCGQTPSRHLSACPLQRRSPPHGPPRPASTHRASSHSRRPPQTPTPSAPAFAPVSACPAPPAQALTPQAGGELASRPGQPARKRGTRRVRPGPP